MPITRTFHQAQNIVLFHDEVAQPNPECFHIFLHGMHSSVYTTAGATPQQAWGEVLEHLQLRRNMVKRDKDSMLDWMDVVTVYAGSLEGDSLNDLQRMHLREFMIQQLHRIAGSRAANGGNVAAMGMLAKLYGVKPVRKTAPEPSLTTRVEPV